MFNRTATSHLPWSPRSLVLYTEQPTGVDGSRQRVLHPDEQAARFAGAFSIRSILSHAARSQSEMSNAHQAQEHRYLSSRVPTACSFVNQPQVACCNEENNIHLQQAPLNQKGHLSSIQSHEANIAAFGTTKIQGSSFGSQDSRPRHPRRGSKRSRTIFTPFQLQRLEKAFERQQYVAGEERRQLATGLNLSETQVKVWFQNRRIRFRKQRTKTTPVV